MFQMVYSMLISGIGEKIKYVSFFQKRVCYLTTRTCTSKYRVTIVFKSKNVGRRILIKSLIIG